MTNKMADAKPRHDLYKYIAEDLNGCGEGRHGRSITSVLEKLEQLVERVLIERSDHRLGNVAEEVIDAEAGTGERDSPSSSAVSCIR